MKETDLLEPVSYYATTKSAQTLLSNIFAHRENKPVVTVRHFHVYGPYEEPTRFIPVLMNTLLNNGSMNLVSPETAHDMIYVDDVVNVYLQIDQLKKYPGEIFNVGTGKQQSIRDIVNTAIDVSGKTADFQWGKMEHRIWDASNWVGDISKSKKMLGWEPKVDLSEGISHMWKWFNKNKHFYQSSEK